MPVLAVAALLTLSIIGMQQPAAVPGARDATQQQTPIRPQAQPETHTQSPAPQTQPAPQDQTNNLPIPPAFITLPAGTRIQLALTSPITSRNARVGYAVRAAAVFPVTVGSQLAIPVGTYLEGVVDRVKGHDAYGRPGVEVHFTRMIFVNGYTVPLDSASTPISENRAGPLEDEPEVREAWEPAGPGVLPGSFRAADYSDSEEPADLALRTASFHVAATPATSFADASYAVAPQIQQPQPPPLPHVGPPTGLFIGLGVAAAVAVVVAALVARRGTTSLFYGAGWQFEIALEAPVSLDANAVAAAAAMP